MTLVRAWMHGERGLQAAFCCINSSRISFILYPALSHTGQIGCTGTASGWLCQAMERPRRSCCCLC